MLLFKLLWLFDAFFTLAAALGFIFYLFRGLLSKAMTGTWLCVLGLLVAVILSAGWLKATEHPAPAYLLLILMAMPACIYLSLLLATNVFGLKLRNT